MRVQRTDRGRYTVQVHSGGPITTCLVIVGKPAAPPLPDNKPPTPVPIPDVLVEKLRKAYAEDKDTRKSEWLDDLLELYNQAPAVLDAFRLDADGKPTSAREINTPADLKTRLKASGAKLLKPDQLVGMRMAIGEVLAASFPGSDPFTEATRKDAVATLKRIHSAIGQVKP